MQITVLEYHKSSTWYEEKHEEELWTLLLVSYGKCVYWIRDKKHVLEKGQLLLIPAGVSYYGKSVPTMIHEKYVVRFTSGGIASTLPLFGAGEGLCRMTGKYELILDRLRTMAEQWHNRQPYYAQMCQALFSEVLVHIQREMDQGAGVGADGGQIVLTRMKDYIQNHYREQVTKEELAAAIGRSPNYTATLFRRMTGQTISEYVHAMRIKTAVYMLKHSALNVAEISEFVGYADPSYFYRVFKRLTGEVPTSYLADRESVRR